MEKMITTERVLQIIRACTKPLTPVTVPINRAYGRILASDIIATHDFPGFLQSNMDGYAFSYEENINRYKLVGEVAAGDHPAFSLEKGTAIRIFTGAPLPIGADTVLIQEKATIQDDVLQILDPAIHRGANTRAIGSIIKKGSIALRKGIRLRPSEVGFLAGIGIATIEVYPAPRIGILTTGNELQMPGTVLQPGQVYESNSFALEAALQELSITALNFVSVKDDLAAITYQLNRALAENDLILLTGGVSVGDHDYTLRAFEKAGVNVLFHKVKQKPGKPLLLGHKEDKLVFGLPGNPASVLTCFYEYVLHALSLLTLLPLTLKERTAILSGDFKKTAGLTHFVKAFFDGEKATLLPGQESFKTGSFTEANCFVVIPEQIEYISEGSAVTIQLLK